MSGWAREGRTASYLASAQQVPHRWVEPPRCTHADTLHARRCVMTVPLQRVRIATCTHSLYQCIQALRSLERIGSRKLRRLRRSFRDPIRPSEHSGVSAPTKIVLPFSLTCAKDRRCVCVCVCRCQHSGRRTPPALLVWWCPGSTYACAVLVMPPNIHQLTKKTSKCGVSMTLYMLYL